MEGWVEYFKKQIAKLGPKTYLSVMNQKGNIQLRYRLPNKKVQGRSLPFRWHEDDVDDAYIRIRNIYNLMLHDIEFGLAVDIADNKAPMPDEDRDWKKASEEYKVEKLTRGTSIGEATWNKEHFPVINNAVELMTRSKPPRDPAELINKTTEGWQSGSRTRQQRTRNLAAFLRYCVNVQKFPPVWNPPSDLSYHIGRKPASMKGQKVDPITDQEILDLIDSLDANWKGSKRDQPHAKKWADAIRLMAAFGLRPEELKHLERRTEPTTKEKYLWCSYQKRAGGGVTPPRRLYLLPLVGEDGISQSWDLVESFHQKNIELPSLQSKNGVGEAARKYLMTKEGWKQLRAKVEARGEHLGTYSFRHSYSVRGHQLDIDGGSMATAMGYSYETHCREYPWATKSGTTSAFKRAIKAA